MFSKFITSGMMRAAKFAAGILCFTLTVVSPFTVAMGAGGSDAIHSLYSTLLSTMQNGQRLGPRGRYAQLEPIVQQVFDIPFMTQHVIGPQWEQLSAAQHQQASVAFGRYIAAVYAERFDKFSGEQFKVGEEQSSPAGPVIASKIIKSDGEAVNVNYLIHGTGGNTQIIDVYLNGTISELATRRSEFGSILRMQGFDALIKKLNDKVNELTGA